MSPVLRESDVDPNPLVQLGRWLEEARAADQFAWADAMVLATVGVDGCPNARAVILRGLDDRGLLFFTDRESTKGVELSATPSAAALFLWPRLERQARVRGVVASVHEAELTQYFAARPRDSTLAAWAARQSSVIDDRADLERRLRDVAARFGDAPIPRPPTWQGYRIIPSEVELWQQRPNRLHDRLRWTRTRPDQDAWALERLAP